MHRGSILSEDEEIISESTVFNTTKENKKLGTVGSRDLTEIGQLQKTNRRMFFDSKDLLKS